ncbi:MAG: DUF2807 domain-containing protein [Defluviitaleaceae bacterium]|nr:DUF2807 domain-containing protein [Defluviitaleaceae bacterium]
MYELEGFGARLQQLRKQKGMTQEDLAHRVGVTGQAVSKWETDQSYPDITLITSLATILEADIHYLFGKKEIAPVSTSNFPQTLGGMPMVHSIQGVACYSNKNVLHVDASGVKFTDGSTAELSNKLAINMGKGEIKFIADEYDHYGGFRHIDHTITSMNEEYDATENIEIEIGSCRSECHIIPSQDGKTRVKASGDAIFIHTLNVEVTGKTLKITQKPIEKHNSHATNKLTIEMPCEAGGHAKISINGSSSITSEIPKFTTGALGINGSGTIKMLSFDSCTANINGSGEICGTHAADVGIGINGSGVVRWETSVDAKVSINGSGDVSITAAKDIGVGINGSGIVTVNKMTGDGHVSTRISGSGIINIKTGSCIKFGADISGSGDITADGLTVNEANIVLHNDGNVILGWVKERSSEQIKKKGTIKVLRRGNAG